MSKSSIENLTLMGTIRTNLNQMFDDLYGGHIPRLLGKPTDEPIVVLATGQSNMFGLHQVSPVPTQNDNVYDWQGPSSWNTPDTFSFVAANPGRTTPPEWTVTPATVTIVSTSTTATVTHTAHDYSSNMVVLVAGANETDYNGFFTITVVDADTYTYTMAADPVDTATGTITARRSGAFTGMPGNNNGHIGWSFCDWIQEITGRDVYMVTVSLGGAAIEYWASGAIIESEIATQMTAALAAVPSGPSAADFVIWMQGESNVSDHPQTYSDNWVAFKTLAESKWAQKNYTQWLLCGLANDTVNGWSYSKWGGLEAILYKEDQYVHYVNSKDAEATFSFSAIHYLGDGLQEMGKRCALVALGMPTTPHEQFTANTVSTGDVQYSNVNDSSSEKTAFAYDTDNALTDGDSNLASWANNGTVKAEIDKDGDVIANSFTDVNGFYTSFFGSVTSTLPFQALGGYRSYGVDSGSAASVTIVSTGTTATVTHTAHGYLDDYSVRIAGANETDYNGIFTITVVDANSYTYTMAADPVDTATGTITAEKLWYAHKFNTESELTDADSRLIEIQNNDVSVANIDIDGAPTFGPLKETVTTTAVGSVAEHNSTGKLTRGFRRISRGTVNTTDAAATAATLIGMDDTAGAGLLGGRFKVFAKQQSSTNIYTCSLEFAALFESSGTTRNVVSVKTEAGSALDVTISQPIGAFYAPVIYVVGDTNVWDWYWTVEYEYDGEAF